jgi:hypothetical protein
LFSDIGLDEGGTAGALRVLSPFVAEDFLFFPEVIGPSLLSFI